MKIKRVFLIFAATLAVTGCAPSVEGITESLGLQEESVSGDASVEDEAVSSETNENTTEAEAPADETAEAEGEAVSDEELNEFTNMFTAEGSEYFGFLWPEYNSPEEIEWNQVIAVYTKGLTAEDLTNDEMMELYGTTDDAFFMERVIRRKDLTKYIKDLTGLDVTPEAKDFPDWEYNEKCDAFLISDNPWGQDSPLFEGKFVSGTKSGDVYTLTFQPNNGSFDETSKQPDRVITFEKSGDKLMMKSNKIQK